MKLLPRHSEQPDVNLTPMIDVVFLLLLFFMVSTSFIRESALKVDLPQATGEAANAELSPIDIVIRSNGDMLVNERVLLAINSTALREALELAVGETEDPHIVISADAESQYQLIVMAMDVAQQLGYTRLTLATRQKTAETP